MKLQEFLLRCDRPFLIHLFIIEESTAFDFSLHKQFAFPKHNS